MQRHFVTILALGTMALLLDVQPADAQLPKEPTLYYQFDRPYFHWPEETFVGDSALLDSATVVRDSFDIDSGSVVLFKVLSDSSVVPWRVVFGDSSAVIMLSSQPHPSGKPGARLMMPPAMPEIETTRWLRQLSDWRSLDGDSVEVAWRTGHSGATFRLEVQGDTLRGRVRFTVDIVGREPQVEDAWAVRVACPAKGA